MANCFDESYKQRIMHMPCEVCVCLMARVRSIVRNFVSMILFGNIISIVAME